MAGLADMLVANTLQQNDTRTDPGNAFAAGAQIALHGEELQKQQQQLQMQKQQLQEAKLDKVMNWFEKSAVMPEGQVKNAFLKYYVPNGIKALGLDDTFHPDSLKMTQSDPALIAYATNEVKNGRLQVTDLYKALRDPDAMASLAASPGFKVFGAQQDIQETLQNSIGELRAAGDVASQNSFKEKELKLRAQEQASIAKMRLDAADAKQEKAMSHQDTLKAAAELNDFGKQLENPTTRSTLGRYRMMIDATDSVKTLANAELPPNATREQKIAAYNKLTLRQQAEVVKGLDRVVSLANPTVHGNESLGIPETPQAFAAKWGEKISNVPKGANQGEFVLSAMDTIDRENKLNSTKLENAVNDLKKSKPLASKVHGDTMDALIKRAVTPVNTGADVGASDMVTVGGRSYNRAKAQQILNDNPDDPLAPAFAAALKGM